MRNRTAIPPTTITVPITPVITPNANDVIGYHPG